MDEYRTLSILVVEDDFALADLVRRVLNDVPGWGAVVVHHARAALDVLRHVRVNLLILDVNLPGISGTALLDRLRRVPGGQHPPVLMMSANPRTPEVDAAVRRGEVVRFLPKPFDLEELVEAVQVAARAATPALRSGGGAGPTPASAA